MRLGIPSVVSQIQQALCHTIATLSITGFAAGRGEFPPKPPILPFNVLFRLLGHLKVSNQRQDPE